MCLTVLLIGGYSWRCPVRLSHISTNTRLRVSVGLSFSLSLDFCAVKVKAVFLCTSSPSSMYRKVNEAERRTHSGTDDERKRRDIFPRKIRRNVTSLSHHYALMLARGTERKKRRHTYRQINRKDIRKKKN